MASYPMKVFDTASLESVAVFLHDARFMRDGIVFDRDSHRFSIKCYVYGERQGGMLSPVVWNGYQLVFSDVLRCDIIQKEDVCFYEISTLEFDPSNRRLTIFTHYAVEITLELKKLTGMLTETKETRTW